MNGEGGIGAAEQEFWSLKHGLYASFELPSLSPFFIPSISVPMGDIIATINAGILAQQGAGAFVVGGEPADESGSGGENNGPAGVVPFIDPDTAPYETVFETEAALPDVSFELPHKPTDWEAVYAEYVILNPEVQVPVFQEPVYLPPPPSGTVEGGAATGTNQEGVEPVATWTDIIGGAIDVWQGQQQPFMPSYGPTVPYASAVPQGTATTKVTYDPKTGKVTKCRTRRPRALLTNRQFNDILRISTLKNNELVRIAVAKAIR